MGLGGYLAARTDTEHYMFEESRENYEIEHMREKETEEVETIFREYGLQGAVLQNVVNAIASDRKRWIDFMMRFELGLERPSAAEPIDKAVKAAQRYVVELFH